MFALGENIARIRTARGLTQDGLAQASGVSDVVEHLTAAQRLAPQWSRVQPLGHTVVGQLVEHRGRRSERITELVAHYGTGLTSSHFGVTSP